MGSKRISKKILKTLAIIVGGILVLLLSFHLWFINHAEGLIENLVAEQSNGKVKLQVKKFKFNWFSRKMELQQAVFYTTDTVNSDVAYRFEIGRLKVQVTAISPIIFEKKFLIDSLHLLDPDIRVTRLRSATDTSTSRDTSMSIPQEMGRVYNSIQDALKVLQVDRFQIDNGRFSLVNKSSPGIRTVQITNIDFFLDNLTVDSTKQDAQQKILFSDNVALQTHDQDILFPDGRHRLSFRNFRINIANRIAEFDSCTILATRGDSSNNSFRIFFDKLRMTNIDFDTLYHAEVIKADSVYCINPRFILEVDIEKKSAAGKTPQLDELIQQLTGDMQLAFVVVENASFDIRTQRDGRPSSFISDNNNFELQGLRIREKAVRPLVVDRFAMAIRNYENFLRDSTYAIQFDSILINNNRISLSNFSYQEMKNGKALNSLSMPQFELYGLSWDNLIFQQQLKAERVTLYQPVINYDFTQISDPGAKDVFGTLYNIGRILQLSNLNIVDGKVNLLFKNKAKLQLEHTTMFLLGQQLVASKKITGIRQSVDILNFKRGLFSMGTIKAEMTNVQFAGNDNRLKAERILVNNKDKLAVDAQTVAIQSMILDDQLQRIMVNGISWDKATVQLSGLPTRESNDGPVFILNNIRGTNTSLNAGTENKRMAVELNSVSAGRISTETGKLEISDFAASGHDLVLQDSSTAINIQQLRFRDNAASELQGIVYNSREGNDSTEVQIPSVDLVAVLQQLINGNYYADRVSIREPNIKIHSTKSGEKKVAGSPLPDINIGKLNILHPEIEIVSRSEKGVSEIYWQGKLNKNKLEWDNLKVNSGTGMISADALQFNLDQFRYSPSNGKSFETGKGAVWASLKKLELQKNEIEGWDWKGIVSDLTAKDFVVDSLGKNSGRLLIQSARLQDLAISSTSLLNPRELVRRNASFRLQEITGQYHSLKNEFNWFNGAYDRKSRLFTIDSFAYRPTPELEEYIRQQPYQSDYLTVKTAGITIGPFDIDRYVKDTVLDVGIVNIEQGFLTSHRDKRTPRKPGFVTKLPAGMLKQIPVKLLADSVRLNHSTVIYEEVNEKNNELGSILLSDLNGRISRLRNFNFEPTDSLEVEASAYLAGEIYTQLHVKESYTDSLGGFKMTGQMGPADLTILNPILRPLVSVELKSGQLDTMSMRVIGREELAYGEMKLFYHDLKVRVIKNGKGKNSLIGGIMTFLANTLIKNKNEDKTTAIFNKRLRDRSAINYLVKTALSGFGSSIGIKKNKKMLRKHRKEISQGTLPRI